MLTKAELIDHAESVVAFAKKQMQRKKPPATRRAENAALLVWTSIIHHLKETGNGNATNQ